MIQVNTKTGNLYLEGQKYINNLISHSRDWSRKVQFQEQRQERGRQGIARRKDRRSKTVGGGSLYSQEEAVKAIQGK